MGDIFRDLYPIIFKFVNDEHVLLNLRLTCHMFYNILFQQSSTYRKRKAAICGNEDALIYCAMDTMNIKIFQRLALVNNDVGIAAIMYYENTTPQISRIETNENKRTKYLQFTMLAGGIREITALHLPWKNQELRDKFQLVELKKSADSGNQYAQTMMGYCYQYGITVEKSRELAIKYYELAQIQGDIIAARFCDSIYGEIDYPKPCYFINFNNFFIN